MGLAGFSSRRLLAALCYIRPALGRPKDMMTPLAKQALRGWKRLAPGFSRLPLAWEMIAGLAMQLLANDRYMCAAGVLLCVIFYLRPGEMHKLRVRSLTAPLPSAGPGHLHWAVALHDHDSEDSMPSV